MIEEVKETISEDGEVRRDHPAMGVISLSRTQISPACDLFGSNIKHGTTIELQVSTANEVRRNNHTNIYPEKTLLRVSMSLDQWARLVSSIGMGEGVPVTLQFGPDADSPLARYPRYVSRKQERQTVTGEFSDHLQKASDGIKQVQSKLQSFLEKGSKAPSKTEIQELISALRLAGDQFSSNSQYIANSFQRVLEASTQSAKSELEAFALQVGVSASVPAITASEHPQSLTGPYELIED